MHCAKPAALWRHYACMGRLRPRGMGRIPHKQTMRGLRSEDDPTRCVLAKNNDQHLKMVAKLVNRFISYVINNVIIQM